MKYGLFCVFRTESTESLIIALRKVRKKCRVIVKKEKKIIIRFVPILSF